ncbi:hypothetical protein [Kozakia baliensis]|uniref:hypothetical protein n=1 Tax=Kozakia baliensis TaxID=153496 RepID=UPI0008793F0C|nr:hypothetical protein [Kozakia baliensis]AOX20977.1 hypothetical protein A0U90_12585 [Kozakia baliensis]
MKTNEATVGSVEIMVGKKMLRTGAALAGLLGLSACAHRDAVDTVGNWWHQYQGGVIAQQRPPPPGAHAIYPHVGLTPTQPADVPSAPARTALTDKLTLQRNFGQRLAAADGPLPNLPPNPTPRKPAMPSASAQSDSGSSMTVDAAGQTPSAPTPPANAKGAPDGTKPVSTAPPQKKIADKSRSAPAASMPAVTQFAPPPILPGQVPQMMSPLPPSAPQFPGFDIPRDADLPDRPAPAYDLSNPHGTLIRFAQASDQMMRGQEHELGSVLGRRGGHALVYVKGFGEASSLRPMDQASGIRLGLLRARTVAEALMLRGVPGSDIRLAAGALGQGARIDLTSY